MNVKIILTLISISLGELAWCQTLDTTVTLVNGKVINASTKEPLAAHVKYESIPYGSKIGVMSGDSFTFNMENQKDYQLKVSAEGYFPYEATIKVEEAENGRIEKIIELKPNTFQDLIRLDKLIFALGNAEITDASHEELNELANMLNGNPNMIIQLEGHTDFRGNPRQNMKLSQRRVDAVKEYLIDKGISKKRIRTKAFGGTQPMSRGTDAAARSSNRRVEVRILEN
ncbi:OmpA family protein [Fulvivirga ligni]|uniref:OmpA family protein n=1 Tax=Fulvivirga ligni TaxID=2904246 RepID=UPI001F16DBA7|nr:OmpA family protein [Fulvivirga ligni]UII22159.1 OmpA family protein [Fulvivirga ligni]